MLAAIEMLGALYSHLENKNPARSFDLEAHIEDDQAMRDIYRDLHLITTKVLYVCNVDEALADGSAENEYTSSLKRRPPKKERIL